MPSIHDLTLKRYDHVSQFLNETRPFLEQQEIKNTFVIHMAQQAEEKKHSATSYYCGTIWNNKDLLFAIFAENEGFLYASCLFDETRPDAIAILFNDVISSSLDDIQGLHAYQPVLSTLGHLCQSQTGHELQRKNPVWSHQLTQVDWTPRALSISQQQESMLRIATKDDLDLLRPWTIAFIKDVFGDTNVILESVESICRDMIESRSVYMLCINGVPVTMARKVRPLKYGCSLAYVYTPEEHRHKGYGEACVSMVSNLLLKEFQYVTLFVDIEIDPHNNLYTRVGYEHYGEAGRFVLLK